MLEIIHVAFSQFSDKSKLFARKNLCEGRYGGSAEICKRDEKIEETITTLFHVDHFESRNRNANL